jgi:hypothetical protein
MANILTLITSIVSLIAAWFGNSKVSNKRKEEIQKVQDKQQEINFQSQVEEIVKAAESKDEKTKADALNSVRVLVSE